MPITSRLFLLAALGVVVSLAGLIWDAQIHIFEHGSLVAEALLNPSEPLATNPGHLVFGLGFLLTAGSVLGGFAYTWLQAQAATKQKISPQGLALPLALAALLGVAGMAALYLLGQAG